MRRAALLLLLATSPAPAQDAAPPISVFPAATVVARWEAEEARQGVAVDARYFYAVDTQAKLWRASSLVGMDIHNHAGEDLGEVHELVLSGDQNKISYAVLSFGGLLGRKRMRRRVLASHDDAH